MGEKVDKLFAEYEKIIKNEKEELDDHTSINHGGSGEEPPPSPSSSDISHHSNHDSKHTSKKLFFKLDIKFVLLMYNRECSAEKLNNWIRQIEVYCWIQQIEEDEAKVQLASLRLSGTALIWWESKLHKGRKKLGNFFPLGPVLFLH